MTNNLVSVASPGDMALTYSLLLMMTRCFCLLIKAIPSLVSANLLRAVLREADQSALIHQMAIFNSGSSHWAWAQSTTLISPLGPVLLLVSLATFIWMLSSISACCRNGLCNSAQFAAPMVIPSSRLLTSLSPSHSVILLSTSVVELSHPFKYSILKL